jgi:predicted ribosome quality control (RQC) complex YloA/Tae2 family protein
VLTDGDLKILALLRNVEEGAEHEQLRAGLQYNLSLRQNYGGIPELTKERVQQALQKAVDRQKDQPAAPGKKAKKSHKDALRKALAVSITECPPLLVDHALHIASFDSSLKPEQVLADEGLTERLLGVLQQARNISEEITSTEQIKGYILAKPNPAAPKEEDTTEENASEKSNVLYDDFHPFQPQQFQDSEYKFLEFDGFNKCVDEFFSSIEGQKLESKLHEREIHARKKLDQARKEHESRIGGLQQTQELNFRKAEAILANIHRVEEAIAAVNGLIGQGMDWGETARLIEREQEQGNAVAELIKLPLKLHENTITLLLEEANEDEGEQQEDEGNETSEVEDSSDEDEPSESRKKATTAQPAPQRTLTVDVDLSLTAYKNSSEYFDQKKTAKGKEARTIEASERAMKAHERKVAEDLKKGLKQEKEVLRPVRRQQWFEKFIYFISSDGYLVLGGKDGPQNEIIYRRYLRKGDIYVHADLKGAVPMIIKNNPNTPDSPIPPSTLSQAGHLSVCTSEAWDSKAVMSAWWVKADQVSKIGHGGEFLATGMFNITGRKEFLPPAQLVVGLAVMFEISEDSKARHRKHRVNDPILTLESKEETTAADDGKDAESDSDEDFPDAKPASDSEDDFPDTKLEESDDSDVEEDTVTHANPLQRANQAAESEDEDHTEPQKPTPQSQNTSTAKKSSQEDAGSVADSEKTDKTGHRHLSARERRLLRKGQPLNDISVPSDPSAAPDAGAASDAASASDDERTSAPKAAATVTSQTSKASKAPLPRGKRAKAKKLAAKYADQDEEDRQLALRLLGAQSGPSVAETVAQEQRQKEEEAAANKQRRREQHLRAQATGKAAEEARRAANTGDAPPAEEEGDDEQLVANLANLDAFIGRPLPEDTLLSAIPVCAPWSALSSYKYKAKMQPGSLKRGKAVKDILSKWDIAGKDAKATDQSGKDVERIWPREMELIRGWKEPEVVSVVSVPKVRVMMAGGRDGGGLSNAAKGKKKSARGGRGSKKK